MKKMRRVKVFVLGGTITMAPDLTGAVSPVLSGSQLLSSIPALKEIADVIIDTPFLKPGASLEMSELAQLAQQISGEEKQPFDGAVVVQGTDTIDETAFLLDLLCNDEKPVIVTGAMRSAKALSADGPANLFAAISVAAAEAAQGLGCLVVLNDEIHSAYTVEKMSKGLTSSFESPNSGALGYFFEGQVTFLRRPFMPFQSALCPSHFPKVAIIKVGLGQDGDLIEALPELGYEGAVIESMGAGHVPAHLVAILERLSKEMPVVLASRVIGGPIFRSTYGFAGSEMDLADKGLISSGWLSPHKARLLLTVCLGCRFLPDQVRDAFAVYGQP